MNSTFEKIKEIKRAIISALNSNMSEVKVSLSDIISYGISISYSYVILRILEEDFRNLGLDVKREKGSIVIRKRN